MKHVLALFVFVASFAHAAEIKVFEAPVDYFRPMARSYYAINQQMGRAWVEIEMYDPNGNGEAGNGSAWYREKVPGLAFDAATSTITLDHGGQIIECATVTFGRFRTVRVRETGCQLQTRRVRLTFDDGYRTYKRDYHQVFLITR